MKLLLRLFGVLVLVAGPAHAEDFYFSNLQSGSFCKRHTKAGWDDDLTFVENGVRIYNSSASAVGVFCPMTHICGPYSFGYAEAVLNVGGTTWAASNCQLRWTSWNGIDHWIAPSPSFSTNVSTNSSQFHWNTQQSVPDYASFAFSCTFPPNTSIIKAEIVEKC